MERQRYSDQIEPSRGKQKDHPDHRVLGTCQKMLLTLVAFLFCKRLN